ncbi:MAG: GNAT family N-acetyltransferase [Solirubrobacterales bacterium]
MGPGPPRTTRVVLRDGRVALVGPLQPTDRERYLAGLERASPDSIFKRFMTPIVRLSEAQLRYLIDVDHTDHEAFLAIDEDSGTAVAVARFVRADPGSETAEAAVIVIDDWQGNGLGKALSVMLAERARELGVASFEATLLLENRAMMGLLESLGRVRTIGREGAAVVVTLELPDAGIGDPLAGVLRVAASGEVEVMPETAELGFPPNVPHPHL